MRKLGFVAVFFFSVIGLFFLFHPQSQAEEITTISYNTLKKQHPNITYTQPVRLSIPTIKVDATVESVGLDGEQMAVPDRAEDVGWYQYGSKPGEKGNAVIDGHLDDASGEPAIFWRLALIRPNDIIYTTDTEGRTLKFRVVEMREYPYSKVPVKTLFTNSQTANLVLITCSGQYDQSVHNYSDRLVVFATLIQE